MWARTNRNLSSAHPYNRNSMFMRNPTPITGGRRRVVFLVGGSAGYLPRGLHCRRVWTDYLWFDSVGYAPVWWSRLWTRVGLLVVGVGLSFLPLLEPCPGRSDVVALSEPGHERPGGIPCEAQGVGRPSTPDPASGRVGGPGRDGRRKCSNLDRPPLPLLQPADLRCADPLFNNDVGFYVFQLPFITICWSGVSTSFFSQLSWRRLPITSMGPFVSVVARPSFLAAPRSTCHSCWRDWLSSGPASIRWTPTGCSIPIGQHSSLALATPRFMPGFPPSAC